MHNQFKVFDLKIIHNLKLKEDKFKYFIFNINIFIPILKIPQNIITIYFKLIFPSFKKLFFFFVDYHIFIIIYGKLS
jgi:hypothetical protein